MTPTPESTVDYVYVESRGAHGVHVVGSFDAFVGSHREIWIGSDGSGLIRESRGPVSFFTPLGEEQWRAAGSPELAGSGIDLFAPACLGQPRSDLRDPSRDRQRLESEVSRRSPLSLKSINSLLGEALVAPDAGRAAYEIAARLDRTEALGEVADQLGRVGHGLARVEHGERLELIFDAHTNELLGYQRFLVDPGHGYAPVGTLVSWCAYIVRRLVHALPSGTPPIPGPPCSPPGSGRGTSIEPGFSLMTGYFDDLLPHLDRWRAAGVITDAQHQLARSRAAGPDHPRS